MSCNSIRENLLAHLYGALEDEDEAAVAEHLETCSGCREALKRAEAECALLSEATRIEADGMVFAPPRSNRTRFFTLPRIAAAAAVVLAIVGLFAYRTLLRSSVLDQHPRLVVSGPATITAGAPARFQIRAETIEGAELPATIDAAVTGTSGVLHSISAEVDGDLSLELPADIGRPGEILRVDVRARFEDAEAHAATIFTREAGGLRTYVGTDKPLYRPGEAIRARAVVLSRFRLDPAGSSPVLMSLVGPRGDVIQKVPLQTENGVAAWQFGLPPGTPGGEYKIEASHPARGFATVSRTVGVRAYRPPRLSTDLELDRDSYRPGEGGLAMLSALRAEGGIPAGATVTATVSVDGEDVATTEHVLAGDGTLAVAFRLPDEIHDGRARIQLTISDGGTVESAVKTIPVTLDRVDAHLYPEGGELVAGFTNRVYFSVRDPNGDAADLAASVVTASGEKVADARVDTLGMGAFDLVPRAGETYRLRAGGLTIEGNEIAALADGVVLRSLDAVAPANGPLRFDVASTRSGEHTVVAWCRDVLVAQETVTLEAGEMKRVELLPDEDVGGVFRVTVLDAKGDPRAERLVSRVPARRIEIEISPDAETYAPGETVNVTVTTTNENGEPVPAVLGLSVADDAVISLADDEDTAPLPMHFLLGLEVEELERVELFAEGDGAARAVDLLLGVQGWRRFAWKDPAAFLADHPVTGPRVAMTKRPPPMLLTADNLERAKASAAGDLRNANGRVFFAGAVVLMMLGILLIGATLRRRGGDFPMAVGLTAAVIGLLALLGGVLKGPTLTPSEEDTLILIDVNTDELVRLDDVTNGLSDMIQFEFSESLNHDTVTRGWLRLNREAPFGVTAYSLSGITDLNGDGIPGEIGLNFAEHLSWGTVLDPNNAFNGLSSDVNILARTYPLSSAVTTRIEPLLLDRLTVDGRFGDELGGWSYWYGYDKDAIRDMKRLVLLPGYYDAAVFTREYAHERVAAEDGARRDFTEVLYWNPMLVTGSNGTTTVSFETADAVTSYRIGAEAHDARGGLGVGESKIRNRESFWLEPKLPAALTAGDRLLLPVVCANDTSLRATMTVELAGETAQAVEVDAAGRGRALFDLTAKAGEMRIDLTGGSPEGQADRSVRVVPVTPRGYPVAGAVSGVLETRSEFSILLPAKVDRASVAGSLRLYPSVVATLTDGIEGMLMSPSGCFEQVSSTTYPNVLVLACLTEAGGASPAIARKAKALLKDGYGKLAGYECKGGGFDWFGGDSGHEALTAYGLMEFTEMARFIDVDAEMLDRTREWLLSRRDGEGGFESDSTRHTFGGAPPEIVDAYVTWALTEAGVDADLSRELDMVESRARRSDDPYLLALSALALGNADRPAAKDLAEKLAGLTEEDGSLLGRSTSITASRGRNLAVETTALGAMVFLREGRTDDAETAVRSLAEARRSGGSFGATQATILALKALTEYARTARHADACDLTVFVNGRPVAERHVPEGAMGVVTVGDELLSALVPGGNRIEIRSTSEAPLPFTMDLRYHTSVPASDPSCAVGVAAKLSRDRVEEGRSVDLAVTITNREEAEVPMTVVRVGVPAGVVPRTARLEELKKAGEIAFFETRPSEVTLYLMGLDGGEQREIVLDLTAEFPGEFEGPATSAYLYYADDAKDWAAPLRIRIDAAE